MPNQKISRKSFLIGFLLLLTLSLSYYFQARADDAEELPYIEINQNATWRKEDNLIFYKDVYVNPGATLTIEERVEIKFEKKENGDDVSLHIAGGRIVANGTQQEPVRISSSSDHPYFLIEFGYNRWEGIPESEPSFLRFVEISNGGYEYPPDDGGSTFNNLFRFVSPVYASLLDNGIPAVYFSGGKVHMENCRFYDNQYADIGIDYWEDAENTESYLEIVNSNFEKNGDSLAVKSELHCKVGGYNCTQRILLKNNWYGDPNGPSGEISNDYTNGKKVVGDLYLDGWKKSDVIADSVIVIPGIMGSAQLLGNWKLDPILHSYDDLLTSLEENGYEKNKSLFEFPYQWRNSNETSAPYLQSKIEGVINETKVSKTDIVAHSMGGLVARYYIEGLDYQNNVDQLVTLGTPHKGAPKAYLTREAGEGFEGLFGLLTKRHFENEAKHQGYNDLYKYIQERILSVRELLPDYDYLYDIADGEMRSYPDNYPRNTFLEELNDEQKIQKLNQVNLTNIIGKISEEYSTISKIRVVTSTVSEKWEHGMLENFYNEETDRGLERQSGDVTVPQFSAESIISNEKIILDSSHLNLPTESQCKIIHTLTQKSEQDCIYVNNIHIPNILLINVFSPIDIQVIAPDNKKIGKDFSTGGIINEIDGAYYTGSDTDIEFLTIPNPMEGEYTILTQGTGGGDYKIETTFISEDEEGEASESTAEITGTAAENQTEELKVNLEDNEVTTELKDETPPTIAIASPENDKNYLNNQILPITYSVSDNISPADKIASDVYYDNNKFAESEIDLSLEHLGNHQIKITAKDEAENPAEETANFSISTNAQAIIDNVNYYYDLKLITNKKDKKVLEHQLNILARHLQILEEIKNNDKIKPEAKEKLISLFETLANRHIDLIIKFVEKDRHSSFTEQAQKLLTESLNFIRPK